MRAEAIAALLLAAGCQKPDCSFSPPEPDGGVLPPGAARVVSGLTLPTQLQFDARGRLFVLEGGPDIPKAVKIFSPGFELESSIPLETAGESTGLLLLDGGQTMLVASKGRIDAFDLQASGIYAAARALIDDLPSGEHSNNGLAAGPDGFVYFPVGSTCDLCDELDSRSATIMRVGATGAPEVYARGLRNVYDVAFTADGRLLAADNGPECCSGDTPGCLGPGADRLLEIVEGGDYGWPDLYRGKRDAGAVLAELPLHGGVTGFALLGCDAGVNAFVTLWGTQHGPRELGRRVLRVSPSGAQSEVLGPGALQHPVDATFGPDGGLYVLDFSSGEVITLAVGCE